jgi:hypothetical protein
MLETEESYMVYNSISGMHAYTTMKRVVDSISDRKFINIMLKI